MRNLPLRGNVRQNSKRRHWQYAVNEELRTQDPKPEALADRLDGEAAEEEVEGRTESSFNPAMRETRASAGKTPYHG